MEDVDDDAECSEANFKRDVTPTIEAQVTSVNVETEHELLRVEGKINGRRALMLIDSGSTHDFIAEQFARRVNLPTEIGRSQVELEWFALCVAQSKGTDRSCGGDVHIWSSG